MYSSRIPLRALGRVQRKSLNGARRSYASTNSATSSSSQNASHVPAIMGGIAGGSLVLAVGYGYYHTSGMKTMVQTSKQAKKYFQESTQKVKDQAPEPGEASKWLRETAQSYAALIPGGKTYVNAAFDDLDKISEKHGDKVNEIIQDAYSEIRDTTKDKDVSLDSAMKVWNILQRRLGQIGELATDAAEDILDNHPALKEKVGGGFNELKSIGDHYGPEVKEQVDKTWDQVRSIASKGISVSSIDDIKSIVQDNVEKIKKMRDETFRKGMEQAKPYLDKSPKAKELVENNVESLKQGNVTQLWQKIKDAVSSGNTSDLESFVKQTVDQAKSSGVGGSGGGLEDMLKKIPGAGSIAPQISKLVDVGDKHGKEAEDILKSAMNEIEQVLREKVKEAENLTDKAKDSYSSK